MKIGIFGGTFNPVHKGHRRIAQCAKQQLGIDKLIIIPTKIPPHKDAQLQSNEDRINMLKLAFGDEFEISDIELNDIESDKSYSVFTLQKLKKMYPSDELIFIMGSDMFLYLEKWYMVETIFSLCSIAAAKRNNNDEKYRLACFKNTLEEKYNARVYLFDIDPIDTSSSQIRLALSHGEYEERVLDNKVYKYILEKGLYDSFNLAKTKYYDLVYEKLGDKRIDHSLGVMKCAVQLAKEYGADVYKAAVCGLVHDITKYFSVLQHTQLIEKYADDIDEYKEEMKTEKLLHAISGAFYAKYVLKIDDDDVFAAIRYHTVARNNMSMLEKIIYIADAVEENRDYDGVDKLRLILKTKGINAAILECINQSETELEARGAVPDYKTILAKEDIIKQIEKEQN